MLWILARMMRSKIRHSLDLLVAISRNIILEEFTDSSKKLAEQFCKITQDNLEFLFESPIIMNPIFFKLCKLLAGWQSYDADANIRARIAKLLIHIWERNSRNCLHIGRELMRIMQVGLKSPDFEYFIRQLSSKSQISE